MSTQPLDQQRPARPAPTPPDPARRGAGWMAAAWAQIPTVLLFAALAGIAFWGVRTEWKFGNPFAAREPTAASKEEGDPVRVTPGPGEAAGPCPLDRTRVRLASAEVPNQMGLRVVPVERRPLPAVVTASAELQYDETRVARLSGRVGGSVLRVEKQVGDPVAEGEVVALVDAAAVGKAKADFLEGIAQLDLRTKAVEQLQASKDAVAGVRIQEAESAVREARVRVLGFQQALVNLGLPVKYEDLRKLNPDDQNRRIRLAGLPEGYLKTLDPDLTSTNLLPVVAPFAGVVVERDVVPGAVVDPTKTLFVVADVSRLWAVADIRAEDADQVAVSQSLTFRADGHADESVAGPISWTSTAIDPRTRTLRVRAVVDNPKGHWRARTFGTAAIALRDPAAPATVVPAEAVQREGDCRYVFVRVDDITFEMRAVRLGVQGPKWVEVTDGVRPGEAVAAAGSFVLKSEVLKGRLADGH